MRHLKDWLKTSAAGRLLLIPYRLWYALTYYSPKIRRIFPWLLQSREIDNFSYDVTFNSKLYTASAVASICGIPVGEAARYVAEFNDVGREMEAHLRAFSSRCPDRYTSDGKIAPGRRLITYALVRARKPAVIVEAGVARGLGSCLMAAALRRNRSEGFAGRIYARDLNPSAGCFIHAPYDEYIDFDVADICHYLHAWRGAPIDFYLHETTNDPGLESREFALVSGLLSARGIVVSAWHTGALIALSQRVSRNYLMFHDEPLDHWYPGARIGIVYPAAAARADSEREEACAFSC